MDIVDYIGGIIRVTKWDTGSLDYGSYGVSQKRGILFGVPVKRTLIYWGLYIRDHHKTSPLLRRAPEDPQRNQKVAHAQHIGLNDGSWGSPI